LCLRYLHLKAATCNILAFFILNFELCHFVTVLDIIRWDIMPHYWKTIICKSEDMHLNHSYACYLVVGTEENYFASLNLFTGFWKRKVNMICFIPTSWKLNVITNTEFLHMSSINGNYLYFSLTNIIVVIVSYCIFITTLDKLLIICCLCLYICKMGIVMVSIHWVVWGWNELMYVNDIVEYSAHC
jgi:hypothetical protein